MVFFKIQVRVKNFQFYFERAGSLKSQFFLFFFERKCQVGYKEFLHFDVSLGLHFYQCLVEKYGDFYHKKLGWSCRLLLFIK